MLNSSPATPSTLPECPTLEMLKTRECSPAELQVALVRLIELHNAAENRDKQERNAARNLRFNL